MVGEDIQTIDGTVTMGITDVGTTTAAATRGLEMVFDQ
jgi:hypothetical protein